LRTGGAGSRHSGINTTNESGSLDSERSRSKWVTIESISSSQKGGLASNEPETGLNSRTGLKKGSKEIYEWEDRFFFKSDNNIYPREPK
jgi:hypothetical protein